MRIEVPARTPASCIRSALSEGLFRVCRRGAGGLAWRNWRRFALPDCLLDRAAHGAAPTFDERNLGAMPCIALTTD